MKKVIMFSILPIILLLTSCGFFRDLVSLPDKSTSSWQTVSVTGIGTFRVPTEWNVEQQDGILYITDKPREDEDYTIYLVGVAKNINGVQTDVVESKYSQPHELFEGVEKGDTLAGYVYSNSTDLHLIEYNVNDTKEEHYLITLPNIRGGKWISLNLLVWDMDVVDEKLASEIAKTFSMSD